MLFVTVTSTVYFVYCRFFVILFCKQGNGPGAVLGMADQQIAKLTVALHKYNSDLAYFDKQLQYVDSQISKVSQDSKKSADKLQEARGAEEKKLRQENSDFQSQRAGMFESMKQNLLTGKARSKISPVFVSKSFHAKK